MISIEQTHSFILTEQLHHSIISGELLSHWKYEDVLQSSLFPSVHYAISMHDLGWQNFDKQPFWNDQTNKPYTFMNFPMMAKLVIYQHGADEIEKENPYAALLCSHHYQNFLHHKPHPAAKNFVAQEKQREKRLKASFNHFNEAIFQYHYGLLSLFDGLSLFAAITVPGEPTESLHPIFRDGFSIPDVLGTIEKSIAIEWLDKETIVISPFIFDEPFSCILKQKDVSKTAIQEKGFAQAYEEEEYIDLVVRFVPLRK